MAYIDLFGNRLKTGRKNKIILPTFVEVWKIALYSIQGIFLPHPPGEWNNQSTYPQIFYNLQYNTGRREQSRVLGREREQRTQREAQLQHQSIRRYRPRDIVGILSPSSRQIDCMDLLLFGRLFFYFLFP